MLRDPINLASGSHRAVAYGAEFVLYHRMADNAYEQFSTSHTKNTAMLVFLLVISSTLPVLQMDESVTLQIQGFPVKAAVSPDGSKVVFSRRGEQSKEIYVANRDGTNPQQLTDNKAIDYAATWSPDGSQIVFCSTRSGIHQIFEMDSDGKNVRQLTRAKNGARHPKYSAGHWLAYQRMYPRDGKSQPADLVLKKDRDQLEAIKNIDISDYAWSRDGKTISIGTTNSLTFFDLATRKSIKVDLFKKDKRLFAHGPYEICWGPNSEKVACRIRFLGGRTVGTKIYGDRELFLIGVDGSFEAIAPDEIGQRKEAWIKNAFENPERELPIRPMPPVMKPIDR